MNRTMMAALAVGGAVAAFAAVPVANAAAAPIAAGASSLAKAVQVAPQNNIVTPVAQGGGRGFGGGGRGFGGGGRSFGGGRGIGGGRGFRGPSGGGPRLGISRGAGRSIGRGGYGGPRHAYGGPRGGKHHHHRGSRFRGLYYAAPFAAYGAYYYGSDDGYSCGWLRRRAEATGSRYWWARYEDCVDDNY
jgi:hypothetical protein